VPAWVIGSVVVEIMERKKTAWWLLGAEGSVTIEMNVSPAKKSDDNITAEVW